jgi:hypothetical protein
MGLTPERFAQMMEAQGYACAMCRTPFEKDQRICIDHDCQRSLRCPGSRPGVVLAGGHQFSWLVAI